MQNIPDLSHISLIQQQLHDAEKADQDIRKTNDFAAWQTVDSANQTLLKQIIAEHGWPKISLVGEKAERAAFLIAQHATADLPLMETALSLRQALPENETYRSDTALLEDRLLMLKQQPQKYGSQIMNGQAYPIEGIDMARLLKGDRLQMELLTARRKTAGLDRPYQDYLAQFGIAVRALTGRPLGE